MRILFRGEIRPRKGPRRGMVVGVVSESQPETKVKEASKTIDLRVYRIHTDKTAEDLADILRPHLRKSNRINGITKSRRIGTHP